MYLCGIIFSGIFFGTKKYYDFKNSRYFIIKCKICDGLAYIIHRRYGYKTRVKMRGKDVDDLYIDHWFSASEEIPIRAEVVVRKMGK